MKKKKWLIVGIVVVVLAAITFIVVASMRKEVVFHTAIVEEGKVTITVMATGYIQPVEEIEVGTQVSGVIEKIYVDFNSHVKKGDLLAELEKFTLQEKLNQSNASLTSASSDLLTAQQNYDRVKKLFDVKAATQVSLEDATNRLAQAKASVTNARANLHQSQVNLGYAYIYSPIDGVVLDRAVNTGQTVAASFNTPTLFTIAEDLTKMQVEADIDEADIGMVKIGQEVSFSVDAYNGEIFSGKVSQIRLQPTVTSNVVTYTVIVDAPNPDEKLFPGMTANITIDIQSETGAAVPIEAINFRMTSELALKAGLSDDAISTSAQGAHGVWVKNGDKLEHRALKTGLEDGIYIIALSGAQTGENVVLSGSIGTKKEIKKAVANPLMPRRPSAKR